MFFPPSISASLACKTGKLNEGVKTREADNRPARPPVNKDTL